MKSKAPLTLMELLIMVLVFAMAVGLCVRIFVFSDQLSQDVERRDRVVFEVQNAAETVKYFCGDLEQTADALDAGSEGTGLYLYYDKDWNRAEEDPDYYVAVKLTESPQELVGIAEVMAGIVDGEELFRVTVGYQEVKERE